MNSDSDEDNHKFLTNAPKVQFVRGSSTSADNLDELTICLKQGNSLSSSLLNKMKNTKIPDEIYGDPVKMLEYEEKEEKDSKVSHGVGDLKAKMAMRGGKLKAEDFLS